MATGAVRYRDSWRTKALRGLRLFWTLFPNTARAPAPALSLSLSLSPRLLGLLLLRVSHGRHLGVGL
jgi:hypothetical protein